MTVPVTNAPVTNAALLGVGDLRPELRATADLLGVELTEVGC